jgi:hypothetical protein
MIFLIWVTEEMRPELSCCMRLHFVGMIQHELSSMYIIRVLSMSENFRMCSPDHSTAKKAVSSSESL